MLPGFIGIFYLSLLTLIECELVISRGSETLHNKHLKVAVLPYGYPNILWSCPVGGLDWEVDCPHERRYSGYMWDILLFMQRARSFTFTIVASKNDTGGMCHGVNNCTGLIGLVNRGKVDIALGTPRMLYKRQMKNLPWPHPLF